MSPPAFPAVEEWQFHDGGFAFRGHHVRMEGGALKILKAIAFSPMHSCTVEELKAAVWPDGKFPGSFRTLQGRICDCISTIRERLRFALLLPESFNPVPCIERGNGGKWTLYIPCNAGKAGGGMRTILAATTTQPRSADPGTVLKRRDPDHRGAGGFAHRPAPLFSTISPRWPAMERGPRGFRKITYQRLN